MGDKKIDEAAYKIVPYLGRMLPAQYVNLVISRWMRSYRFGNDYLKLTDSDHYFQSYSVYINRILYAPETVIRLAVLTDDPDVALGFAVFRGHTLDYVHVHKDCRKQGIAKFLLGDHVKQFTHLTRIGMKLWPTKLPDALFTPFA